MSISNSLFMILVALLMLLVIYLRFDLSIMRHERNSARDDLTSLTALVSQQNESIAALHKSYEEQKHRLAIATKTIIEYQNKEMQFSKSIKNANVSPNCDKAVAWAISEAETFK